MHHSKVIILCLISTITALQVFPMEHHASKKKYPTNKGITTPSKNRHKINYDSYQSSLDVIAIPRIQAQEIVKTKTKTKPTFTHTSYAKTTSSTVQNTTKQKEKITPAPPSAPEQAPPTPLSAPALASATTKATTQPSPLLILKPKPLSKLEQIALLFNRSKEASLAYGNQLFTSATERMNTLGRQSWTLSQLKLEEERRFFIFMAKPEGIAYFKDIFSQKKTLIIQLHKALEQQLQRQQTRIDAHVALINHASRGEIELYTFTIKEAIRTLKKCKNDLEAKGIDVHSADTTLGSGIFISIPEEPVPTSLQETKDLLHSLQHTKECYELALVHEDLAVAQRALEINEAYIKRLDNQEITKEIDALKQLSLHDLKTNALKDLEERSRVLADTKDAHYTRWQESRDAISKIDADINAPLRSLKFWATSKETLRAQKKELEAVMHAEYIKWGECAHQQGVLARIIRQHTFLVSQKEIEAFREIAQQLYEGKLLDVSQEARDSALIKAIDQTHKENFAQHKARYILHPAAIKILKQIDPTLSSDSKSVWYNHTANRTQHYVYQQLTHSLNRLGEISHVDERVIPLLKQAYALNETGRALTYNNNISGALSAQLACEAMIDYAKTVIDFGAAGIEGVSEGIQGTISTARCVVDAALYPEKSIPLICTKFNNAVLTTSKLFAELRNHLALLYSFDKDKLIEFDQRRIANGQKFAAWEKSITDKIKSMPLREKVKATTKFFTECALLGKAGGAIVETVVAPAALEFELATVTMKDILTNPKQALSQEIINIAVQTMDKDPALVKSIIEFAQNDTEFLAASNKNIAQKIGTFAEHLETKGVRYQTLEGGERCRVIYPEDGVKAELIWAPKRYEEIRALKDDVQMIAKNTGMQEFKIQRIKNHVFYDEHILRTGEIGRFGADPEMASAWDRLYKGDFIQNDLQLLEHEYFESKFEKLFKVDSGLAHDKTQHPIKGRRWSVNKYREQ